MSTAGGIAQENWAVIDGNCPMRYEVVGGEIEINLGRGPGSLHLICDEEAVARLLSLLETALRGRRPPGGESP